MERSHLDGLITFLTVAELRGFRAAGRRLGITPSAVSQAVRALEARVGGPLFSRTTRSVRLTEAGERLLSHAEPAIAMLTTGLDAASDLGSEVRGRLRITAPRAALALLTNRVVPELLELYPNIELEMVGEDELIDIVKEGFDAGIRFGHTVHADMVAVSLTPAEKLTVVGSPTFFRKYGKPNHPKDLEKARCILLRRSGKTVGHWHFIVKGRRVHVRVKGPLATNDVDACIRAAVRGAGLFCPPRSLVTSYIAEGQLETALDSYADEVPGLTLYYPSGNRLVPKLRAFVTHVRRGMRA
jgi:DNA-binding transcriptional LysR family regulator